MKKPTDGGKDLASNPFATLSSAGLPAGAPPQAPVPTRGQPLAERNRGRVDIVREKAGRSGKTVTVIRGFTGIGAPEKEEIAKAIQKRCGCGGSVKDGAIEIQGDQREAAAEVLRERGFRPVMAGG